MKDRTFYFFFVFALLMIDQATKTIVSQILDFHIIKRIIPGFLNLTHIRNKGAIFGFFSQSESSLVFIFLTLASLAALGLVISYFLRTPASERLLKISLALILAGALGNMIDRIFRGYVIDFLDFYIERWHWPSFNVADLCISVGALLLIFIFAFKRSSKCSPSS